MFDWLRHRKTRSGHPTPDAAYLALAEGRCMYANVTACSGPMRSAGLRGNDDNNNVLVCRAHYGRLRKLHPHELNRLERHLVRAFTR